MKNLVFAFALLFSTSLVAQFGYHVYDNGSLGTGIESDTNTAYGFSSIALGRFTEASGTISTAMGFYTTAEDYCTTAIGLYNKTKDSPNPLSFSPQNTLFVIGNGTDNNNRSNAFEVLFDGTTTIYGNTNLNGWTYFNGVSEFNSDLIIKNSIRFGEQGIMKVEENNGKLYIRDGNVSMSNDLEVNGQIVAPAFIGDGSQLTNLPTPSVNYSDITNVPLSFNENNQGGIQSLNNTASGSYSTAMGLTTTASGDYSTSLGQSTTASGFASTTMGQVTTASGDWSTAMGRGTLASGPYSTAMGVGTTASQRSSTAMGEGTEASGFYSTAMGASTTASGDYSTAMGGSTVASGSISTAIGGATTAEDYLSFVIGVHNKTDETPNPEYFSYQNTAFVIGNGGYDIEGSYVGTSDTFSNAFEVLFDGTTTIAGDLNINSDARLKANIISLGATLSKLLQIDGKTYTMKKDANHKKKIGLLAQDIEKVFPELVTETNDIKSVNYQGLVPVLINAMKEQQEEIDSYKTELSNQRKEIDELKTMVKQLMSK